MENHKVFAIKLPIELYQDIKEKADTEKMFVSEYIRRIVINYNDLAENLKTKGKEADQLLKEGKERVKVLTTEWREKVEGISKKRLTPEHLEKLVIKAVREAMRGKGKEKGK